MPLRTLVGMLLTMALDLRAKSDAMVQPQCLHETETRACTKLREVTSTGSLCMAMLWCLHAGQRR